MSADQKQDANHGTENIPDGTPISPEVRETTQDPETGIKKSVTEEVTYSTVVTFDRPNEKDKWDKAVALSTVLMFLVTALLFIETCKTNQNVLKQIQVSDTANYYTKIALARDSQRFAENKEAQINQDKINRLQRDNDELRIRFRDSLQNLAVQAQIDAFKESRDQFEIDRRPDIALFRIEWDSVDSRGGYKNLCGKPIFKNFGKVPAYIEKIKKGAVFSEVGFEEISVPYYRDSTLCHILAAPGNELPFTINGACLHPSKRPQFARSRMTLYIFAEITFTDSYKLHTYKTTVLAEAVNSKNGIVLNPFSHPYNKTIKIN